MARPAFSLYYTVKESFWFLPAVMAVLAGAAAIASVAADRALGGDWVRGLALVWSGGAEGARSVLSVIAGSTMTVVSIVFSITITALAQTSSHFGPRVLRNFTRDRRNQFVLGTYVATFLYSLLVLRTVRSEDGQAFVPYVSVNVGIALALMSLAVLIFFIHHMATSIQADLLIARVGEECLEAVKNLFPRSVGKDAERGDRAASDEETPGDEVTSEAVGYVQAVDDDALFDAARKAGVLVTVLANPGRFVARGHPLARVSPAGQLDNATRDRIRAGFETGARRTPEQDLAYSVQQLVEIAARALSPSVNEPFTAMLCIDWLTAALRSLAGREPPPAGRKDDTGCVRVVAHALTFPEVVRLSVAMIRRYANGAADIHVALLKALRDLAPALRREADRKALLFEARQIGIEALAIRNAEDRAMVLETMRGTRDALNRATLRPGDAAAAQPATGD
jgi:uncharacterized membrane protein